jgi:hypothetical protein
VNILYELELHCIFSVSKMRDGTDGLFTLLVHASSVRVHRTRVFIFTAHFPKISVCESYKVELVYEFGVKMEIVFHPKLSVVVKHFPVISANHLSFIINKTSL